jgi:p-aminobenzoyl-glutamate transporter AbgT
VTLLYYVISIVVALIAFALVWAVFGISFGLGGR